MESENTFSPITSYNGDTDNGNDSELGDTETEEADDESETVSDVCHNTEEPVDNPELVSELPDLPDLSSILDFLLDGQMNGHNGNADMLANYSSLNTQSLQYHNYLNYANNLVDPREQLVEPAVPAPTPDACLSSYIKNMDQTWLNPSQWMEDMKYEFASLNRRGYEFDSVEFVQDIDGQFLSGSQKLTAFQEGKCFKCNKFPADPQWCTNCGQVYCKVCIMESMLKDENCGQNSQHMARALSEDEYEKRFSRVRLKCEYGCKDPDQNSLLFGQYELGDAHNRGKECPNRKCKECKMWKTKVESDVRPDCVTNCFPNHFTRFSAFMDIKIQLYFDQMFTKYKNQMMPSVLHNTPDVTKMNIQLKYQISEKELTILNANKRIRELAKELDGAKQRLLMTEQMVIQLKSDPTASRLHKNVQGRRLDRLIYQPNPLNNLKSMPAIKLVSNPMDDNPKVTENYVQVIHPKHGIKRINGIQDNMTWDQLKHHIITQFNNEFGHMSRIESYEQFDLVTLKMRVEAGDRTIGGFYYPTMIFNLVPTNLLEKKTAYEIQVSKLKKMHQPSELAKKVGIASNSQVCNYQERKNKNKRKWNPSFIPGYVDYCYHNQNLKDYLTQLIDQRMVSCKQENNCECKTGPSKKMKTDNDKDETDIMVVKNDS